MTHILHLFHQSRGRNISPMGLVFAKSMIWQTDQRTYRQTDGPSYWGKKSKAIFIFWLMMEKQGLQFLLGEVCQSWAVLWPFWMGCWMQTLTLKNCLYNSGSNQTTQKILPLGADKIGHCKSEVHLIEMYCKRQFFQQYDFNALILHGPTFVSNHCGYSPWHRGVNVEEVGWGEGTSIKWVIFAYIMFVPS